MRPVSKLRPLASIAGFALLAILLIAPGASAATKIPSLVSTKEYKDLVTYVKKLEAKKGTATTSAQKAVFTRKLTQKHGAAVRVSSGLFTKAKTLASKMSNSKFRDAATKIRIAELSDIADLQAEYAAQLAGLEAGYQRSQDRVNAKFGDRIDGLREKIQKLRVKKAKAKKLMQKQQIQDQITGLIQQVTDSQQQLNDGLSNLKSKYQERRAAIQQSKSEDLSNVRSAAQDSIDKQRKFWNNVFKRKLRSLQKKRAGQIADLLIKLNRGRDAIASMPTRS